MSFFPKEQQWAKYFRFEDVQTVNHLVRLVDRHRDGVLVSFKIRRTAPDEKDAKGKAFEERVVERHSGGGYDQELGLDPGRRLIVGGVSQDIVSGAG